MSRSASHGSTMLARGTQSNPIILDDTSAQPTASTTVVSLASANQAPVFYGVAQGILPGVYSRLERNDFRMCTIDWPGHRWRSFQTQAEAIEYVEASRLKDEEQFDLVWIYFATIKYANRAEYDRRKAQYEWFRGHRKAGLLAWSSTIFGPPEVPSIDEEQRSNSPAGADLQRLNHRVDQYRPAPGLAPNKAIPATQKLGSTKRKSDDAFQPIDLTSSNPVPAPHSVKRSRTNPQVPVPIGSRAEYDQQIITVQESEVTELVPLTPQDEYDQRTIDVQAREFGKLVRSEMAEQSYSPDHLQNRLPPLPAEVRTEPQLCAEQQNLVDLILDGYNVFYTGSAGCGKSTVLKAFVKQLKDMGQEVRIVAPTGKAALEVGGTTFFTFAGWIPSHFKKPLAELKKGAHQKFVNKRLKGVDVLIIDEISMMENHIFERLNEVMKEARGNNAAFGGVQLVVTGDFCQLPPVKPFKYCYLCGRETQYQHFNRSFKCRSHGEFKETDKWAFKSKAWQECHFRHVNLKEIHRQKDRSFIDILERCRLGKQLSNSERHLLLNHECDVQNPTRLYSTRMEVNRMNDAEYSKLKGETRQYNCFDHASIREAHPHLQQRAQIDRHGRIPALIESKFEVCVELKEGMRIVLLVNLSIDEGLVNGAQGVIIGWEKYDKALLPRAKDTSNAQPKRVVRYGSEENSAALAAANTIHGEHAAYREERLKDFVKEREAKEWPIVEFDNGLKRTIFAECLVYEFGDDPPYSIMSRTQMPLIAGWAMTVHKSQGMTLNKVEVDLERSFEEGQMYVALSRATSLEGLKVRSLGQKEGGGNAEVHKFLMEKFGIAT